LQQANAQVSHQREVIVTLEQRDAETQALMKIMKTTVESAEISMAAASEASHQQMCKISMLQRQIQTMREAFRHFDDLSSEVQAQVVRAGREMGPLLQNSPLLKVALGADSGTRLQQAMSSIASHLEALNDSHAHMRNVCRDVHEGSQHKLARKDADAQDVTACEPTTTAAAALEAATAPGLLSPRKVLDPVVLLVKLQFDEIPFATSPQGKEDIRKTLQMDLARAVKIDASRLRVDMATLSSESALVSIYPDAQSPELRHSAAAVATLLVAQTRVKASRLKRGSISRLITSVTLVSDLAEYVRSVSRLVRLSSFGMAEKAEGDVQPCTLRDVFCYKVCFGFFGRLRVRVFVYVSFHAQCPPEQNNPNCKLILLSSFPLTYRARIACFGPRKKSTPMRLSTWPTTTRPAKMKYGRAGKALRSMACRRG
jgi:hypothetical protein